MSEMGFKQPYRATHWMFRVRDGKEIFAYKFAKESPNTIILIHGVGSNGYLYNKTVDFPKQFHFDNIATEQI